jgi:acyl-CoA synthetase (AMP-forming)/AMP-acid ligase II
MKGSVWLETQVRLYGRQPIAAATAERGSIRVLRRLEDVCAAFPCQAVWLADGKCLRMNIVDPILFQCRYNPSAPAMCAPGTPLNIVRYADLERFIHNVSRKAVSLGLLPGQTVALGIKDKILHAAIILGLTRLGVATVSMRNRPMPAGLKLDAAIVDGRHVLPPGTLTIAADMTWLMGDGKPPDAAHIPLTSGNEIGRIVLTSGTTGEAKAVAMSHDLIHSRMGRYHYVKGNRFPLCSRVYCDLGVASSPGFRYMIFVLSRGGTFFVFGESAEATVEAFDRYRIEVMIASPHGLAEYLKFYESTPAVQCGFDHVISTGSLMSKPLSERIRARMCHHLYCSYGSTEVSTVASAPAQAIADIPGAVGYVTPGVSVEIVDDADRVLPATKSGVVRIRSPYNVDGYVGSPAGSAKAFRDGWFYPGDVGYLTPNRGLVIEGRETAVLNLGGDKVRPEIIEAVLTAFDGVEDAAVFGSRDELGIEHIRALVVARFGVDQQALRAHCAARLPDEFVPIRLDAVEHLPRNEHGKLERHRLRGWLDA